MFIRSYPFLNPLIVLADLICLFVCLFHVLHLHMQKEICNDVRRRTNVSYSRDAVKGKKKIDRKEFIVAGN